MRLTVQSFKLSVCQLLGFQKGANAWMAWMGVNEGEQGMIHIDTHQLFHVFSKRTEVAEEDMK